MNSKRFISADLWDDPAFVGMNGQQRMFFIYLWTKFDLAGVVQLNERIDSVYLGFTIDEKFINTFLQSVNENSERIVRLEGNKLWMPEFMRYQQTGHKRSRLSAGAPVHKRAVALVKQHNLFNEAAGRDPDLFMEFLESENTPQNDGNRLSIDYGYSGSNSLIGSSGSSPPFAEGKKKDLLPPVTGKAKSAETADMKFPGRRDVPDFVFEAELKKIKDEIGESKLAELFQKVKRTENWSDFAETYLPEGAPF